MLWPGKPNIELNLKHNACSGRYEYIKGDSELPLHYGLRADILKKVIRKCLTLKIDFSANFNLTHDFFWAEALSTPQKLENAKMNLQISI